MFYSHVCCIFLLRNITFIRVSTKQLKHSGFISSSHSSVIPFIMAPGPYRVTKRTKAAPSTGASAVMRGNSPTRTRSRRDAVTGEMIQEQLKPMPRSVPSQRPRRMDREGGEQALMRKALKLPRISSYERTLIWTQMISNLDHDTVDSRR